MFPKFKQYESQGLTLIMGKDLKPENGADKEIKKSNRDGLL